MGIGSPFMDKSKLRAFLKDPLLKKLETYLPEYKPPMNNDRTANRTLSFERTSTQTDTGKQS